MKNYDNKKTLNDVNVDKKNVIVRVDFNVPMEQGKITDTKRIDAAIPTIQYLINKKAKIILLSHFGRIEKIEDIKSGKNSLEPISVYLNKALKKNNNNINVIFVEDNTSGDLPQIIKNANPGDVILLQNTRYNDLNAAGEKVKLESKCDDKLSKFWASLGEVFVNDAFATAHRNHASNSGIAKNIKESCVGLLMQKEIENLSKLINNPKRPVVSIIGGAKIADKIDLIYRLCEMSDTVIIGGGMALTFLKAQGYDIGKSFYESEMLVNAKDIFSKNKEKIFLPIDFKTAPEFKDVSGKQQNIQDPWGNVMGLDIGTKSIAKVLDIVDKANTIFWNGPLGVFEFNNFSDSTIALIKAISKRTAAGAQTVVGGGDSAAAAEKFGTVKDFTFISTGGGAALTFLDGSGLPGLDPVKEK